MKFDGGKDLDRPGFLKVINSKREHPAFLFVSSKNEQKIPFTNHQDGSVTIDSRTRILLPPNEELWTNDLLEAAYEALSRIDPAGFDQSLIPALAGLANGDQKALSGSSRSISPFPGLPHCGHRSVRKAAVGSVIDPRALREQT